ncbi:MAG TPA: zinc-dependent alcohol dehydrogenase family protein [Terriglobales bacterium]|nr:zinc-dependent alcohol dehydrogenase family protein [Terriglobales bacterium]
MRAMLLEHPRPAQDSPLHLEDLPTPTPGPGEIRVRVRCCGLCHTDLHTVEGDLQLPRLPLVPGHQIVGVVDARGRGAQIFKEGDRVGIPWLHSTDNQCDYCRRGLENLCDRAQFTGFHVDGGYADYTVVGESYAYRIPEVFSDENAAPLLCAGIIGYRSYRLSGILPGQRLGLYGFGASAHLVLQFARHQGCEIYVFTRTPIHRELAQRLGAAWVSSAEDAPPHPLDAAIIFAPAGALVPLALRVLRKAGTLTLAGITMSSIPAMDYSLLYHERVIRSVANSTRQDAREFLNLAAQVPLQTEVEIFDLEQANQALQALKKSEIKAAGVLRISKV